MEKEITHADWRGIFHKYGSILKGSQVCEILGISLATLNKYTKEGKLKKLQTFGNLEKVTRFHLGEVMRFAEKYLGIKDGSYIHDNDNDEAKDQEHKDHDPEDFFTSICNTIIQRIADAKEIAEKNGSQCGLSYLVGCFDITNNSIRNYIQTLQEGGGQ